MTKKYHVTTTVNGDEYEVLCEPQQTLLDVLRDRRPFRLAAEIAVDEPAVLEAEIAHAPVGNQLQHAAEQLVLQRGEDGAGGFRVHELGLERAGAAVVHPGQLLHGRVAESQLAALDLLEDLVRDGDLSETARRVAARILETDPTLSAPEHETLRKRIGRRYERGIALFRVG